MKWLRGLAWTVLGLLVLGAGWLFWPEREKPLATPEDPAVAARLNDPALIEQGRYLAMVGDCAACHSRPGGQPYAGGEPVPTPFGAIPVPNITPDHETGMGDWRFEDFWQALHAGVGRHGELLYPAFPYTSYTRMTREDALAMFAYLRSLPAVSQATKPVALEFPYSVRRSLHAWRGLYFQKGVFEPDPAQSAQWNRGAYLVQGPAHCNECHAVRDSLGGTPRDAHLTGGQIPVQNWYAPDLSMQTHGGLQGWSAEDVFDLLKTGQSSKGVAFGPMADIVAKSTQHMRDEDLRAIVTYMQTLPARPLPREGSLPFNAKAIVQQGEHVYVANCAECHGKSGEGVAGVYPPLKGNPTVVEPSGINATRVVLLGGFAPTTAAHPRPYSMPPFAQQLSDDEVSAVVSYIRRAWGNEASVVKPQAVHRHRETPVY